MFGSLVAGAAGLVTTGAFSTVEANRTATVETAGDADALLGIEPVDGVDRHVEITNGTITIDFEGINQNAVTVFDRLFKITNNGNDTITVGFNDTLVVERDTSYEENPTGWAYAGDSKGYLILWGPYQKGIPAADRIDTDTLSITGFTGSDGSGLVNDNFGYEYELGDNRTAGSGESLFIGGTVDTRTDVLSKPDDLPNDLDNTFTLVAEQHESN
jgi:hypothetical protein